MITIILLIGALLVFPSLLKSTDRRYKERKEKTERQMMLREEIKHGKRWG